MKNKLVLLGSIILVSKVLSAQSNTDIIKSVQKLMTENYIFLDKAEKVNEHLDTLINKRYFNRYKKPKEFAEALTKEVQKITNDKHLNIAPPKPQNNRPSSPPEFIPMHLQNIERFRQGGFGEVSFFEGNVAYIRLKGFRVEDTIKVDPLMKYVSTADAIIIDLRDNGGGNGPVGINLSSYFLPENLPLTSVYTRRTDTMEEYSTIHVQGKQKLDVPLFILTNNRTFSAAEAFAYDLQARNRATIIGEVTGGGAHPVNFMRLPQGYRLIVPIARSINPVTNTNWEGVGVIPDIKLPAKDALAKAKKIAKTQAKEYREKPFRRLEHLLEKDEITKEDEDIVCQLLEIIVKREHLESFMVNDMGYNYLRRRNINGALAILRAGTILFPNSPNAQDSYAEVLVRNNQNTLALKYYQEAVFLAKRQKDEKIELYQKNLEHFKAKM
ncbi:S41 family peptidase [Aquimarina sp. MMG016]|uniref:S41 family peptidase n=1 Tax=Aquimarina sp. MMG016 TaxID=2822690 RepID=UPI001B39CE56|nr:S41 family peptidase [Aquimarina sp. MMG016]MBQ4819582.1 S41 family peptidase [Aquimarina sp. MMG016]